MVRTWVFGIAYRKTVDAFRKRGKVETRDELPEQIDPADAADMTLNARQEAVHLKSCLNGLSEEQRLAISLAYFEDMTYDEIAEVAGVPAGTVKSRVFHAKKLLAACMRSRIERAAT